jgi:hypothetical protein
MIVVVEFLVMVFGWLMLRYVDQRLGLLILGMVAGFAIAVVAAGGTWEGLIS